MRQDMMVQVLWIDDEPNEDFMNEAYKYKLNLTVKTCVNEGLEALRDKSKTWDAIILDANCKITNDPNEQTSLKALKKAVEELVRMRTAVPWFVYTGGGYEGVEHLEWIIKDRDYDDKMFYNKPKEKLELFYKIHTTVVSSDEYRIRQQHREVFSIYSNSDLVSLLLDSEKENFVTDTSVPNKVRKIVEWIMNFFHGKGLLQTEFKGSNIAMCSREIDKFKEHIVPIHVARSLHFCVEVSNDGSHVRDVEENIASGKALYLNKSLIFNLLNILQWCQSLEMEDKDILEAKILHCQELNRKREIERSKKEKTNNEEFLHS